MSANVVDPVAYCQSRAKEALFDLPVTSEKDFAALSIAELFFLFNDCPLFFCLKPRDRRSYLRKWISLSLKEINECGLIATVYRWNQLGNLFLRSFKKTSKCGLSYEPDQSLTTSPVFSAILRLSGFREHNDLFYELASWILNCHIFLAKIKLTRPDLEIPSETDWVDRQGRVVSLSAGINDSGSYKTAVKREGRFLPLHLLDDLKLAVSFLYDEDFPVLEKHGKHGPGSTNVGLKKVPEKELAYVPTIQSLAILPYDPQLKPFVILSEPELELLKLVAKDIGSMRPITMGSICMQMAQQSLKRIIYRFTDNVYVNAGHFITYADQSASQRLALMGSRLSHDDTSPATIDLSSASDLLSVDLVSQVFTGNNLHDLMSARAWKVQTSDRVVEVQMYAGMGSATTFPVQTIVFNAIAIMATCYAIYSKQFGFCPSYGDAMREYLSQDLRKDPYVWKYVSKIRIYGDDIIVPEIAVRSLLELLEKFGLKVNDKKSFWGDLAAREACGIYALAGHDITPVRYRVPPYVIGGRADFAVFEAYRSLANHSFCAGYKTLYRGTVKIMRGLRPHMSRQETGRKFDHWSFNRKVVSPEGKITSVRVLLESREFNDPTTLFEAYRGDKSNYIGIISLRDSSYQGTGLVRGELRGILTTYLPKSKTDSDPIAEYYHYGQNRYFAAVHDVSIEAHGRIPRGIRLRKRIAYQPSGWQNGWAWAPSGA